MEIPNPKRILVLSTPEAGALAAIEKLTGTAPVPIDDSIAGITHSWTLKTQYYNADLSIWIDDISDSSTWSAEFSKPEAKEVITAVGAVMYIFRKPVTEADLQKIKSTIKAVKGVVNKACGEYYECTCLALGTKQSTITSLKLSENDEWEDFCQSQSFEYIDAEATGRNEFGEPVGMERLREALETTDWEGEDPEFGFGEDEFEGDDDFGDGWEGLAGEQAEMNVELLGMKTALNGQEFSERDEEEQVEEMGRMMSRLMAIKDTTSAMPEEEKKKFAAKAVKDFMKDV